MEDVALFLPEDLINWIEIPAPNLDSLEDHRGRSLHKEADISGKQTGVFNKIIKESHLPVL